MGNVWFLVEALKNTLERDEDGDMTIEDAIGKLVLRDMLERQQEEEDGAEGVQMMTLHASKGLDTRRCISRRRRGNPPAPLQH